MKKMLRKVYRQYKEFKKKNDVVNDNHSTYVYDKKKVKDYRRKGFSLAESGVFDLRNNDFNSYISTWEATLPSNNVSPYYAVSWDKYLFSVVFGKFIEVPTTFGLIEKGEVIPIDKKGLNRSNLYDFFIVNKGGVIKDRFGSDGFDIYIFNVKDNLLMYKGDTISKEKLQAIALSFEHGIIQSKVEQGEFENRIYDKSINTIRVISMRKANSTEHEVVAALQRIGTSKSEPVDNFNQGGASALIDIDTGVLGSMTWADSWDDEGRRIFYDTHPDNGAVIRGSVIPNWDDLKEMIQECTKEIPFFEYIAWDVVVKDDGFLVIEINRKSSLNVFQVHGGLRHELLGKKYQEHGWLLTKN